MSTNYKIAVWERDCEKMQNQFASRLYDERIRDKQGSVITLILTGMMLIAYIAGLHFTRERVLLTQIFCMYLFGASLILLISGLLTKYKREKLKNKISREEDLQIFYKSHKDGVITRIKYIQDCTVTYEIKSNEGSTFHWVFTVDKVEQMDGIDTYIIYVTGNIVKIEVPVNSF